MNTRTTPTTPITFETITYTLGQHYAPALINGDWTGLNDEDTNLLQEWFAAASDAWTDLSGNRWVYAHEAVVDDSEQEFARCEVCLLPAATIDITMFFRTAP